MEFALICLPFFIILFAIIDFAEIYFYENSLQNALREACRFATAGRVIQARDSSGNPLYDLTNGVSVPRAIPDASGHAGANGEASRFACIRYWFQSNCVIANFPLSNITIISEATLPGVPPIVTTNGAWLDLSGPTNLGPGQYNDYVQISATYHVGTITPLMGYLTGYGGIGNTYPVHVSAIFKNEPAILNFEHTNIYPGEQ
ncbi:MAG TPA: TadE family protein [Candidatus Methylacidiphilales bacterium]